MLQLRVNVSYPEKSTEKTTTHVFCHFYYLNLSLPFFYYCKILGGFYTMFVLL